MNERRGLRAAVLLLAGLLLAGPVLGQAGGDKKPKDHDDKKGKPDLRVGLGESVSPAGTLVVCYGPGAGCVALKGRGIVFPEDSLLALPGVRADVELAKGAVKLSLLGNADPFPMPVLESAVRVHRTDKWDLDLTLDRGRILIANQDKKGAVRVRVRVLNEVLALTLDQGASVALETYSRWLSGAPFLTKPKEGHAPVTEATLLVLGGKVKAKLNDGQDEHALQGKTIYQWGSDRAVVGPLALKKVPDWADQPPAPAKELDATLKSLGKRLAKIELGEVVNEALAAKDPATRRLGVAWAGAIDRMPLVWAALNDGKSAETRAAAVLALRHFVGRGFANDVALYDLLVKNKFKAGQAQIVMELLHGFTEKALAQAGTYDALIQYLKHDQLAVRELAHWHLVRIVPQGRDIAYDAAGTPQQRDAAFAAWRKLIPEGQLPPVKK